MEKIHVTLRGYQQMQDELRNLKNIERPKVVEAISAARQFGDLSENAEYHAAKDKQGMIEARITDLEDKIGRAMVIDSSKISSGEVKFGATVSLLDEESDTVTKFQIVGSEETDIKNGLLPVTSPLAKALIGKEIGETAEVSTPKGVRFYVVQKIEYI